MFVHLCARYASDCAIQGPDEPAEPAEAGPVLLRSHRRDPRPEQQVQVRNSFSGDLTVKNRNRILHYI